MKASVDGIEDGIVRLELEDRSICEIPIEEVPFGICEGDILVVQNNKVIGKDDEEKRRRVERIRRMREQILARQQKN